MDLPNELADDPDLAEAFTAFAQTSVGKKFLEYVSNLSNSALVEITQAPVEDVPRLQGILWAYGSMFNIFEHAKNMFNINNSGEGGN